MDAAHRELLIKRAKQRRLGIDPFCSGELVEGLTEEQLVSVPDHITFMRDDIFNDGYIEKTREIVAEIESERPCDIADAVNQLSGLLELPSNNTYRLFIKYNATKLVPHMSLNEKRVGGYLEDMISLLQRDNLFFTAWEPYYINHYVQMNLVSAAPAPFYSSLIIKCTEMLVPIQYQGMIDMAKMPFMVYLDTQQNQLTKFYRQWVFNQKKILPEGTPVIRHGSNYYCMHCLFETVTQSEMVTHINYCYANAVKRHQEGLPAYEGDVYSHTFVNDYFRCLTIKNDVIERNDLRTCQGVYYTDPARLWLNYVPSLYFKKTMEEISDVFVSHQIDFTSIEHYLGFTICSVKDDTQCQMPCQYCDDSMCYCMPTYLSRLKTKYVADGTCYICGNWAPFILDNDKHIEEIDKLCAFLIVPICQDQMLFEDAKEITPRFLAVSFQEHLEINEIQVQPDVKILGYSHPGQPSPMLGPNIFRDTNDMYPLWLRNKIKKRRFLRQPILPTTMIYHRILNVYRQGADSKFAVHARDYKGQCLINGLHCTIHCGEGKKWCLRTKICGQHCDGCDDDEVPGFYDDMDDYDYDRDAT